MRKIQWWLLGLILLCGASGGFFWYQHAHRDDLPTLTFPDLDIEHVAARVLSVSGGPEDRTIFDTTGQGKPLEKGDRIYLGSEIHAGKNTVVALKTQGDYYASLEKDGVFILQDARTDADRTRHSMVWVLRKGLMRIKSFERDQVGKYWIEIRTPHVRFVLKDAEVGMDLDAQGKGRAWMSRGSGVMIWNDGRRKQMNLKGLEFIQ